MKWYIYIRNLNGKVNPGMAIIVSEFTFKKFNNIYNNFYNYWIGPYKNFEYEKAIIECNKSNIIYK